MIEEPTQALAPAVEPVQRPAQHRLQRRVEAVPLAERPVEVPAGERLRVKLVERLLAGEQVAELAEQLPRAEVPVALVVLAAQAQAAPAHVKQSLDSRL